MCVYIKPAREIWDGERLGIAKALQTLGANQAYPINKLKAQLPLLIKEATTLYYKVRPVLNYEKCAFISK
jgi:Xaa-Pro aminopeptidase